MTRITGILLAVALAVLTGVVVKAAGGQTYVGGGQLVGAVAVDKWYSTIDLDTREVTVIGYVENRSDVALANVTVGLGDEDIVEVQAEPALLLPGETAAFTATLYTGTNLTARLYVMADPVAVERYAPLVRK